MLWDRILVKPDPLPTQTSGGLHIPDTVEVEIDNLRTGKLVRKGPGLLNQDGVWKNDLPLTEGDRVVFNKRAGEPVVLNGEPFKVMGARDVLMVLDPSIELSKISARVRT